jgi:hypothetical protein
VSKSIEVRTTCGFDCPFCGLHAESFEQVDNPDVVGVLHAQPACPTFLQLTPDQYIHAVANMMRARN